MTRGQISAQQLELLGRRLGLDQIARQVVVAGQHLALGAGEGEVGHRDAHGNARIAGLARRAVGDVLAAAKARDRQLVVDVGAVREGQ
ncbi:hypothetical protein LTR94_037328, partial [Friedmanniomyces endolithicus]